MGASLHVLAFLAAAAGKLCEFDGTFDGPRLYQQEPAEFRTAVERAAEFAVSGASKGAVLEALPESLRLVRSSREPEEHWWVYGSHKRYVRCSSGVATESYFTQYAIISIRFAGDSVASCAVIWRAFFSDFERPDPRSNPDAPPWRQERLCSEEAS